MKFYFYVSKMYADLYNQNYDVLLSLQSFFRFANECCLLYFNQLTSQSLLFICCPISIFSQGPVFLGNQSAAQFKVNINPHL